MFKFCNELTFFHISTHVLILQVYITTRIPLVTDLQKPNPFLGWFHCEGRNVEASGSMHEITSPVIVLPSSLNGNKDLNFILKHIV